MSIQYLTTRRHVRILCGLMSLAVMAVRAEAVTTNNVTWSGGAGAGSPGWNVDANWLGGVAPSNPTPATVFYNAGGQSVTGVLDAARSIGKLSVNTVATNHVIDIGGYDALTLAGNLESAILGTLAFTNGTLRIGSDAVWGNITLGSGNSGFGGTSILSLQTNTTFNPYRLDTILIGYLTSFGVNGGNARLDLRGALIAGGELRAKTIRILAQARGPQVSCLALDDTTSIDALVVSNELTIGEGFWGGASFIGNPADSPRYRLPSGIDIRVGASLAQRGSLQVGKNSVGAGVGNITLDATLAASSGGTFTGYLSTLKIVPYESSYTQNYPMNGLLDLAPMDSCSIDVQTILVAPNYSLNTMAQPRGTLRVCPGTVTAGTVEVGAALGAGYGVLQLSNTVFTVTNTFTIAATGVITNYLGSQPKGIDVSGTFSDGGGRIRVVFTEAPAVATNWAIRITGDARASLNGMVGSGRLTSSGTYAGKESAVVYDGTYTYFAMVDEFISPPIALARDDVTVEMEPGGTVLINISEMNNGSYDPEGRTPVAVKMSSGGPFDTNLSVNAFGDHTVAVKIEVGDPVEDSATDNGTLHIVALDPGATANRTWLGAASTVLMNRREWWWKGSWLEGTPPANPTTGTITFGQFGTSVTSLLEQARQVGGVTVSDNYTHTLNLGGCVLTVAGIVNEYQNLNLTNGTLRVGADDAIGNLRIGHAANGGQISTLRLYPGAVLDTRRVGEIKLGNIPPTHVNDNNARLDLRGGSVAGNVLSTSNLLINCTYRNATGSYLALDTTTVINAIAVTNQLVVGSGSYGGLSYIGNPAAAGYRLPTNVSIRVGISPSQRGFLQIGQNSGLSDPAQSHTASLAMSTGGTFEAYLTALKVVPYEATYSATMSAAQNGTLDLGSMSNCILDASSFVVAANYSTNASANPRGTVRLPPGTVTAGSADIGATNGVGFGILTLSNTLFTVTNTLSLNRTAQVTVNVGAPSSGFFVSNAVDTAFSMATATNNALVIRFIAEPVTQGVHAGFRWLGDHVAAVQALVSAGTIVINDAGLGSKRAGVFRTAGSTYIGIRSSGTVFVMH